jgi:hypothetical protein
VHTFTSRGTQVGRPDAIAVLPEGYGPLFDRAVEVLGADERVRGVWLSGSLARGTADAGSDLDLLVAVADEGAEDFAGSWREWLAAITPTVIARPLPFLPGSFYSVTPTMERLDVVVERISQLPGSGFRERLAVLDRDDLGALVPAPEAPPGPDPDEVARLVEELLRIHSLLPVVLVRADWLLGVEGVHTLALLAYQLFCQANAPQAVTGAKQWSVKLTPEQRAALEAIPRVTADRESIVAGHCAAVAAVLPHAREIATRLGVPWPSELEAAVRDHLARTVGEPAP